MSVPTSEQWRPIPGWDGYEVSNLGRVMSYKRRTPVLLRQDPHPKGYLRVGLYDSTRGQRGPLNLGVHRLVMLAFTGPRPEGMEVCHNDGNPANNQLSNLRYDTHIGNVHDSIAHGTHWATHVRGKRTHCRRGHPYDEANTRRDTDGARRCRTCQRAHKTAFRQRARDLGAPDARPA